LGRINEEDTASDRNHEEILRQAKGITDHLFQSMSLQITVEYYITTNAGVIRSPKRQGKSPNTKKDDFYGK
jgi:hypothetical protein